MIRLLFCLLLARTALAQNSVIAKAIEKNKAATAGGAVLNDPATDDYQAVKTFTVETGASPAKLALLNDVPPQGGAIVFLDACVGADGKVGFWQFYTYGPGDICFGVYNKRKTKAGLTLLEAAGRNCLTVNSEVPQYMEIEIPPVSRLSVNGLSVVAIEYPSATTTELERVVPIESNLYPASRQGLTLGRIMVVNEANVQTGKYIPEETYYVMKDGVEIEYKAFPAVKAIVMGFSHVLDLRGGEDTSSGVAMIFMNNVWGTMCDRWYHEKGWPYLFCAEKDFPDTEQIYFTDTPERHLMPDSTPIHLKNPRCKFSQNVTMFSCATHDNVTCNHTNDLYIKCKSKVELRRGAVPSEGVAYVYESNYWGTICDAQGPVNPVPSSHWSNVVCRSRGFAAANKLTWAKDEVPNNNSSISRSEAVSMHSPVCSGGSHGADIKQCTDGNLELRCDHDQDIYIRCLVAA